MKTDETLTCKKFKSKVKLQSAYYLDLLALWGSTRLLSALLPLLGFTAFNSVDGEFDAGGCVLGGSVGDGGG